MSWRDRIVCDGTDRAAWEKAREAGIGASDAKQYARETSVDRYVMAKIRAKQFFGNETTRSGNRWEPMILAYLGVPENKALVHAPGNPLFFATPDGIDDGDPFTLAEVKTRHGIIRKNPTAAEWRQLAWQFLCFPEAERILFGTATVLRDDDTGFWEVREGGYSRLEVPRDHPNIVAASARTESIAERVLAAMPVARRALSSSTF